LRVCAVELLFMFFAIYLCYCTRAAPSNYREVRYISWAVYNETIVSAVFYVCRLICVTRYVARTLQHVLHYEADLRRSTKLANFLGVV